MKRTFLTALAVIVVGSAVAYFTMFHTSSNSNVNSKNTTQTANTNAPAAKQLFKGSQLEQYAYLISGDTMTDATKTAMSGFKLTMTPGQNGDRVFNLEPQKAGYKPLTVTLKTGQSLYFIETSLADDTNDSDSSLSDDTAIVVGSDGYIVQ